MRYRIERWVGPAVLASHALEASSATEALAAAGYWSAAVEILAATPHMEITPIAVIRSANGHEILVIAYPEATHQAIFKSEPIPLNPPDA